MNAILEAEARNTQIQSQISEVVKGSGELYSHVADYVGKKWHALEEFTETFHRSYGAIRGVEVNYRFPNEDESRSLIIGCNSALRIGGRDLLLSVSRAGKKPLQLKISEGGIFFIEGKDEKKFDDPNMLLEAYAFACDVISKVFPNNND